MSLTPVLLVVDDDPAVLERIRAELARRYSSDYEVLAYQSVGAAHERLRDTSRPVALLLADLWMSPTTGVEFLASAHALHPGAKRALLIEWTAIRRSKAQIVEASTLGVIDCAIRKPEHSPDEQFHQVVTDLLAEWTKDHAPGRVVVRIVGEQWSPRGHEIRDLLARYGIPFAFLAVESPEGMALLQEVGAAAESCPVVVLDDGTVMANPTNGQVADALGGNIDSIEGVFDVVVVGAGPAGLASAVYAASEGLRTLVIEREAIGGQAGTTSRIRNYLGFPRGISGSDLAVRAFQQASHFGASFRLFRDALDLRPGMAHDGTTPQDMADHELVLSNGEAIRARAVVVATGVTYCRLGVPSLEGLVGRGVFYGPAITEAPAMAGQPVFVVGGGNSAGQAAVHLAPYASTVTMVVRGPSLAASMSDYLVQEIHATRNIRVLCGTEAVGGIGDHRLEALVLRDRASGTEETVRAGGLFVLIGAEPHAGWLPPEIGRCPRGYIITGDDLGTDALRDDSLACHRWPEGRLPFETSVRGVFAVGDVRHRSVKRVASAAGEGAMVIALVHEHLARLARGLEPESIEVANTPA